jgi:hypothetical protein
MLTKRVDTTKAAHLKNFDPARTACWLSKVIGADNVNFQQQFPPGSELINLTRGKLGGLISPSVVEKQQLVNKIINEIGKCYEGRMCPSVAFLDLLSYGSAANSDCWLPLFSLRSCCLFACSKNIADSEFPRVYWQFLDIRFSENSQRDREAIMSKFGMALRAAQARASAVWQAFSADNSGATVSHLSILR